MKKLIITILFSFLFAAGSLSAQDYPDEYLGLPGDNLNLYAVMDLFKESATLEGFERSLNDPGRIINNLDLDRDGYVDYILIKDFIDGNVHAVVLRIALSPTEFQDVAVFIVEKLKDGSVLIQLIGDEALYGKDYIIEPIYPETPNPGYKGNVKSNKNNVTVVSTTYYQVAAWPVVSYIYMPAYSVWNSPWYWGYYPGYWVRWSPHYWHYYYGYHYNSYSHYYGYYRPYNHYRYSGYNSFYYSGRRHYSPRVATSIREGSYRSTYSRPEEMSKGKNHYHDQVDASRKAESTEGRSVNSSSTVAPVKPESQKVVPSKSRPAASVSPTKPSNATQERSKVAPQKSSPPAKPSNAVKERSKVAPQKSNPPAKPSNATQERSKVAPQKSTKKSSERPSSGSSVNRSSLNKSNSPAVNRSSGSTSRSSNTGTQSGSSSKGARK